MVRRHQSSKVAQFQVDSTNEESSGAEQWPPSVLLLPLDPASTFLCFLFFFFCPLFADEEGRKFREPACRGNNTRALSLGRSRLVGGFVHVSCSATWIILRDGDLKKEFLLFRMWWWGGQPDRCWGVAASCGLLYSLMFGSLRCSGLLFVALVQELGLSRREAAWPFSVCFATFQLIGPLVSLFHRKLSGRAVCLLGCAVASVGLSCCFFAQGLPSLILCYGVIHGLGLGLLLSTLPSILSQYFVRHRASAMGLAYAGSPLSSFFYPSLVERLWQEYGIRGTFLVLGGLMANGLVLSALLRTPPWLAEKDPEALVVSEAVSGVTFGASEPCKDETKVTVAEEDEETVAEKEDAVEMEGHPLTEGSNCVKEEKVSRKERNRRKKPSYLQEVGALFRHPIFPLIVLSMTIFFPNAQMFQMILVDAAADRGIPQSRGLHLITLLSATDLLGRLAFGWLTDRGILRRKTLFALNLVVIGAAYVAFPAATDLLGFGALALLCGLFSGSNAALSVPLQAEYMGAERLVLVCGVGCFFAGCVSFARPRLTGLFRDVIGSYDWLLWLMGLSNFVLALAWQAEPFLLRRFLPSKGPVPSSAH